MTTLILSLIYILFGAWIMSRVYTRRKDSDRFNAICCYIIAIAFWPAFTAASIVSLIKNGTFKKIIDSHKKD